MAVRKFMHAVEAIENLLVPIHQLHLCLSCAIEEHTDDCSIPINVACPFKPHKSKNNHVKNNKRVKYLVGDTINIKVILNRFKNNI